MYKHSVQNGTVERDSGTMFKVKMKNKPKNTNNVKFDLPNFLNCPIILIIILLYPPSPGGKYFSLVLECASFMSPTTQIQWVI